MKIISIWWLSSHFLPLKVNKDKVYLKTPKVMWIINISLTKPMGKLQDIKFIVYFTNYNKLSITRNRLFANSKIICKSSYKNRDAFRILSDIYCMIENFVKRFIINVWQGLNPLNANNTKRSNNTQTVPRLHPLKNLKGNGLPKASFIKAVPDNCLSEVWTFCGVGI